MDDRLAALRLIVTAAALGLTGVPAFGEKADRDKPTQIEADAMHYDDVRQTNVFTGNVTLTKGTLIIRGDRLLMRQDAEGYQYGTATGNPATFRQKRDGVEQHIQGRAQTLEYDGRLEVVRLRDRAQLKRTEHERVTDEVHGNLIVYDSRREQFTVESGGQKAATPENPGGRVRVVIQPRNPEPGASPGTAAPAPGGSAATPNAAGGTGAQTPLKPAGGLSRP